HRARDWRPALCDVRSVDCAWDVVPMTLRYPNPAHSGETYGVRPAPGHRWWYVHGMWTDVFVLIK
ncbi:hypothetical protein POSPLADRAFT_1126005, partial [Postia placenta MAD-698-R-SB12]